MTRGPQRPRAAVAVVGATASGKTDLALDLARALGGELVSADSRQVYRGLDAGTAKPLLDAEGRAEGVPCHLLDCADPSEIFDAGRFAEAARRACAEISGRGLVPIICGGTGLYVRALLGGLSELPRPKPSVRARLEAEAEALGRAALHARLAAVDPAAAAGIPPNNLQRVVRALEVFELTGKPISELWARGPRRPAVEAFVIAIEWPAEALAERIAARARLMWPAMIEEARAHRAAGRTGEEPGFQSLGYHEALACASGAMSPEAGLEALVRATLAYAKRQRTWFRGQKKDAVVAGGSRDAMLDTALHALGRAPAALLS